MCHLIAKINHVVWIANETKLQGCNLQFTLNKINVMNSILFR